jgi:hypothetical protein
MKRRPVANESKLERAFTHYVNIVIATHCDARDIDSAITITLSLLYIVLLQHCLSSGVGRDYDDSIVSS